MERGLQVRSGSPADMSKIKKSGRQRSSARFSFQHVLLGGVGPAVLCLSKRWGSVLTGSLPSSAQLWAEGRDTVLCY